jgi:Ca2+-binding EF-hand superfamily protein
VPKKGLFSEEVLRHCSNNSGLRCQTFLQFVHTLADIQTGIECLLSIDPAIGDSISFSDFQEFIEIFSERFSALDRLQEGKELNWYKEFYVPIVMSRFAFFMGTANTNRFDLRSLVSSKEFLQFLRMDSMDSEKHPMGVKATTTIYNLYVALDSKREGMLSPSDLKSMRIGGEEYVFSPAFTSRIFDVLQTYDGKVDFGLFLSLYFPLRYMSLPAASHFFFEIFDVDEDGVISIPDIAFFFKSLVKVAQSTSANFDYYLSEMFDMAQCQSNGITEEMLKQCGEQAEIVKMLIDVVSFSDWDKQEDENEEVNEE